MLEKEIRDRLKKAKAEGIITNYRITKDGGIHIHGIMQNTNQEGWYYLCDLIDWDIEDLLNSHI